MTVSRTWGMPASAAEMHSKVPLGMRHKVKTIHGESEEDYGNDDSFFAAGGIGQGSGGGPTLWNGAGSSMQIAHERVCPRPMTHSSPNKRRRVTRSSDAYMDDSTLGTNDQTEETSWEELAIGATMSSQQWANLLAATGGSLNLKKCHWCAVTWDFDSGIPRLKTVHETPEVIKITNGPDGELQTIRRAPISEEDLTGPPTEDTKYAERTLGVRPPPNQIWTDEIKHLKKLSTETATKITGCSLTRGECLVGYNTMYLPKLEYSLAATCFTIKECETVQNPGLRAFLSKTGYNQNTAREIVFGTERYGGAKFHHQCVEQGINKVMQLIGQIRQQSQIGEMMMIGVDTLQLTSGIGQPILECTGNLPYLPKGWVPSIREFLNFANATIELTEKWIPPLQRENDNHIMDCIMSEKWSKNDLIKFQMCRVHLQVCSIT